MRCPDCNKFVSLETEINDSPEGEYLSCDERGWQMSFSLRVVRVCVECGTELKECMLEFDEEGDWGENKYSQDQLDDMELDVGNPDPQESGGGRYKKNMIGANVPFQIKLNEEVIVDAETSCAEAASSFNELT